MTKQEFLKLLDRYLAGDTTDEENERLLRVYQHMEDTADFNIEETTSPAELAALEERLIHRFKENIDHESGESKREQGKIYHINKRYRAFLNIAASILLLAGSVVFYYACFHHQSIPADLLQDGSAAGLITFQNKTDGKAKIYFADHSYVELESGSRVTYSKEFTGPRRNVYLQGTGFFQVSKNHSKPFIVYTDRLVTKVLGTSFTVRSNGTNAAASVTVVTGRVAVFTRENFKDENKKAELVSGLVLTPNHAAALTSENKFVKKLAEQPAEIKTEKEISFAFDNTPLSEVFDRLQQAYNIQIIYDQTKMKNCSLSVDMGREGFFRKLDVICQTLNLTYRVQDGNVYLTGGGCN